VEPWGTHHSKFFLLRYATGAVRLIVHTANLRFHDCNSKTQGLWWQDFPPKQQQQDDDAGFYAPPTFETTLAGYLDALALPGVWAGRLAQAVAGADLSAARGVLIGSVPGRFEGGPGGR
jgi:tyrosyl-DNA phosphodiesterase-1